MKTETDHRFWDCECEDFYIHARLTDMFCFECATISNARPDSRVFEIVKHMNLIDEASQFFRHSGQDIARKLYSPAMNKLYGAASMRIPNCSTRKES